MKTCEDNHVHPFIGKLSAAGGRAEGLFEDSIDTLINFLHNNFI